MLWYGFAAGRTTDIGQRVLIQPPPTNSKFQRPRQWCTSKSNGVGRQSLPRQLPPFAVDTALSSAALAQRSLPVKDRLRFQVSHPHAA